MFKDSYSTVEKVIFEGDQMIINGCTKLDLINLISSYHLTSGQESYCYDVLSIKFSDKIS